MTNYDLNTPENWQAIPAFPNYQVSSQGRVRRAVPSIGHPAGRVLRGASDNDGYLLVTLYRDGRPKVQKVHRLVAAAFIRTCPEGLQVNHRDGDKANNAVENLEYVTPQENIRHATAHGLRAHGDRNAMRKYPHLRQRGKDNFLCKHPEIVQGERNPNAKLTNADIQLIRQLAAEGEGTKRLAERFHVSDTIIRGIKFRRSWKHLT